MLSATGSTGRRKGEASLTFFKLRIVDWAKRSWAVEKVEGPKNEADALGGADEGGMEGGAVVALRGGTGLGAAEAGGGVADFRREGGEKLARPDGVRKTLNYSRFA